MYYACLNAGYLGNNYDVIEFIAAFEFTDGKHALYAIHYTHDTLNPTYYKLCGDGNIGSVNYVGTVSNASITTVFILNAHHK